MTTSPAYPSTSDPAELAARAYWGDAWWDFTPHARAAEYDRLAAIVDDVDDWPGMLTGGWERAS